MAEMALTADRLVVIGRGRLIADTTVHEFVDSAATEQVVVRSTDQGALEAVLRGLGAHVRPDAVQPEALVVDGLPAERVGQAAFDAGIVVHELTPRRPSLEEAFMKLTADSVEFHGHAPDGRPTAPSPEEMSRV